jgi:hypothetical protein
LELVDDEAVSAGWERLNGRHGLDLYIRLGAGLEFAASLAFVIPAAAVAPKPLQTVATEGAFSAI